MKRKMVAMMVVSVLAASLAAGCGSSGNDAGAGADTPADEPASGDTEEAPEAPAQEDGGAAPEPEAEAVTLHVFAAASMTETLEKIKELYASVAPEVELVFNFDSSGTLKTQIEEGAECDLFISAAQKQMNQLDITAESGNEGLDYVLEGSRTDLLENKVVLAVPEGNPAGIESFADLGTDKLTLLALGNEDVPVGQYSTQILTSADLDILGRLEADGKITYGSNVKEVTTQVSEATADAGIIYATDAYSAGLTVVDEAGTDLCDPVVYPAAVLKTSANPEAAQAFLTYLTGDDCAAVFGEVGFSMAQ